MKRYRTYSGGVKLKNIHGILMAAITLSGEKNRRIYILNPSELVRQAITATGFPELFQIIQSIHEVR